MIELKNINYPDFDYMLWKKGTLYVRNRRLKFNKDAGKYKSIDLKDKYCIPSLVEPHCHIGICRKGEKDTQNALVHKVPFVFNNNLSQKFSFKDESFKDIDNKGIKFISVDPGSTSYFSGNCFFLDLTKKSIRATNSFKMAVGSIPFENHFKRLALSNESDCFHELEKFFSKKAPEMINKTIKVHVYKKSDILKMIDLKEKYNFKLVILHGNDLVKLSKIQLNKIDGIILGPIIHTSLKKEGKSDLIKTALYLYNNNIKFAITTDHPVTPLQYLRLNAIILKNEGVDTLTSIKLITKNAAKILQMDNYGEIKENFKANLLIFNADPMKIESKIIYEIEEGEIKNVRNN